MAGLKKLLLADRGSRERRNFPEYIYWAEPLPHLR